MEALIGTTIRNSYIIRQLHLKELPRPLLLYIEHTINVIGHSPWGFSGPILQIFLLGEIGRQLI